MLLCLMESLNVAYYHTNDLDAFWKSLHFDMQSALYILIGYGYPQMKFKHAIQYETYYS